MIACAPEHRAKVSPLTRILGVGLSKLALAVLLAGMGREGIEPSRPFSRGILSPLRLPFRHRPMLCAMIVARHSPAVNHFREIQEN